MGRRRGAPANASVRGVAELLIIEDDERIRTALIRALRERGHVVSSAATALEGLRQAVEARPDLIVLDLGLPDLDGAELLRMLRAVSSVPVVVATARDENDSVVQALDAGADDYVLKPFRADQLEARIRAVLRRAAGPPDAGPARLAVGPLVVEPHSRRVAYAGQPVELSPKEFDLLAYLAARAGTVVSKRELLSEGWQLPCGGVSLHGQSHGESFLALFAHRFDRGLYILDEPEAALSPRRQLS